MQRYTEVCRGKQMYAEVCAQLHRKVPKCIRTHTDAGRWLSYVDYVVLFLVVGWFILRSGTTYPNLGH